MAQPPVVPAASEAIRQEVAAVLQSELFSRTPALSNLLGYLCEKTLAGESGQLKEYTIAVEVFGRRADYDQDSDSIVRVEAARLRKRLKQYYETAGADHPINIVIPVGQYVPVFQERTSVAAPTQAPVPQTEVAVETKPFLARRTVALGFLAGIVVILAVAGFLVWQSRRNATEAPAKQNVNLAPEPASGLPGGDELRIRCGADRQYIDRSGKTWLADQYFSGGTDVRSPGAHIWRTPDPELYRSSRQGDFAYDIPLKPGVYELRLHFAETSYGPEEE
jgi:hypothetical protein